MSTGIVEGGIELLEKWKQELESELVEIKKDGSSLELKAKDLRLKVTVLEISYENARPEIKFQLGNELEKFTKERDEAERQLALFKQNRLSRANAIEQILTDLERFIKRNSK